VSLCLLGGHGCWFGAKDVAMSCVGAHSSSRLAE
jgi:hypothetical protein